RRPHPPRQAGRRRPRWRAALSDPGRAADAVAAMSAAGWQGALALAAAWRCVAASSGAQVPRRLVANAAPGQPRYWVKLRSLDPAVGELEPPFAEDGTGFKLELDDPKLGELRLDMALNRDKYSDEKDDLPEILVDGELLEYDPVGEPTFTLHLNETIGPFDKEVTVRVRDRLEERTHHDYSIRVRKPPDFEE
ncbi:unnamed protein product, partial [Prorocentrum cordatum]